MVPRNGVTPRPRHRERVPGDVVEARVRRRLVLGAAARRCDAHLVAALAPRLQRQAPAEGVPLPRRRGRVDGAVPVRAWQPAGWSVRRRVALGAARPELPDGGGARSRDPELVRPRVHRSEGDAHLLQHRRVPSRRLLDDEPACPRDSDLLVACVTRLAHRTELRRRRVPGRARCADDVRAHVIERQREELPRPWSTRQLETMAQLSRPLRRRLAPNRFKETYVNRALARYERPTTYIEIGVREGESFRLSRADSKIGIDPERTPSMTVLRPGERFFETTSDEFFAEDATDVLAPASVHVALVDGLHEFRQVLTDLLNLEPYMRTDGVVIV